MEEEEDNDIVSISNKLFDKYKEGDFISKDNALEATLIKFKQLEFGIPEDCTINDLKFMVENELPDAAITRDGFETFFKKAYEIVYNQLYPAGEEEDEFEMTKSFIQDRLSDLRGGETEEDEFNFQFTSLVVTNAGITGVSAIESFVYLQNVELRTNAIGDLTPFTKLPKLKFLDLSENKITTIAGFNFPNLEKFILSHNQISFVDKFEAPKLEEFDLSNNRIFFLTEGAFSQLTSLIRLYLSANGLKNFKEGSMFGLTKLKQLRLDQNALTNLDNVIVDDMTMLDDIDLGENQITDFSRLAILKNLEVLDVHSNPIDTIEPLSRLGGLENLKYLYIYETPFSETPNCRADIIKTLPHVEEVDETPVSQDEYDEEEESNVDHTGKSRYREEYEQEENNDEEAAEDDGQEESEPEDDV